MKKKIENVAIKKNVAITVLVAVFIVGIILTFYNMLYDANREILIRNGEKTANDIDDAFADYLSTSMDAIKLTSYTVEGMLAQNKSNKEILDYLIGQSLAIKHTVFENTSGLYGYIRGEFLDGMMWNPPSGFVATDRPWYKKAIEKEGEVAMIEPYLDAQTGTTLMAISKALRDGKNVVSMDIKLDVIQKITEESVSAEKSDLQFIISKSGYVVAHSDRSEIGKNYSEDGSGIGHGIYAKLGDFDATDEGYFEYRLGEKTYMVYVADLNGDFICVSVKDSSAVFAPLRLIFGITVAVVIAVLAVIYLMLLNSNKKQYALERLSDRVSATADIYISMYEANLLDNTFVEVYNNRETIRELVGEERADAAGCLRRIYSECTDPSSREQMLAFVDLSTLNERLQDTQTVTNEFLSFENKWRRARFIVSARDASGTIERVLYLVEDIDEEKRARDTSLEEIRKMNDQISSVSHIYFSMHEVDLTTDIIYNIRTRVGLDELVPPAMVEHAQQVAFEVIERTTNMISRSTMHSYVDFSTIDERCKETDVLTEEFLNCDNEWCRARLVVSKRDENGHVEHLLWLIESIDEEKRKRDALTETAQMLNARIMSIANMYMYVYEVDLKADQFTPIKTDNRFVDHVVGEAAPNARESVRQVMTAFVSDRNRDDVIRFIDLSTLARRLGRSDTVAIEFQNKEGAWRRARFLASRRDVNGNLTHVMWLMENIDNEKQERDQLVDMSERAIAASEAKSSFLANVSRELRMPLDDALDTNEKIYEATEGEIRTYAEKIRSAGAVLQRLVSAILDYSKLEAGEMKITPTFYELPGMIRDLEEMIKGKIEQKALTFESDIGKGLPRMLHGDEAHIKQVITNLLINA
ncbi:MAG: sensor histidine kinase, partial [Lachnospiraceae bacterium]|nr:sensor histidine kinase [Lachnospiraceae bacterium]